MVSEEKEIIENLGTVRLVGGDTLVTHRVIFSKDSRYLFCCCGRKIRVYSTVTADLLRELSGHEDFVTDVKVNTRNHLQLISSSFDRSLIFWDFTDGVILKRLCFRYSLHEILVHPAHDNKIFLVTGKRRKTGTSYALSVVDTLDDSREKHSLSSLLPVSQGYKTIAFSPKGDYVACIKEDVLHLWSFKKGESKIYRYKMSVFTCLAFHPYEMCAAAGDTCGRIIVWQGIGHSNNKPVTMQLHWHAHALSDLTFTSDGSYLISGGEEAVLVLWQHKTNHKQFLPRLGGPIAHLTCSPDDTLFAVSHKDNVIRLVSGIELEVKHTIQGLRKGSSDTPIVMACDPQSKTLVMNSMPGILQFYQPQSNHQAFSLDVVKQNFISKTDDQKLVFTQLTIVAFDENGDWLATVENRDDKCTSPEIKLKFWGFDQQTQKFSLNTCVDPPHDGKVMAVKFRPSNCGEHQTPLAVTIGMDGKFKIWTLGEEMVIKGKSYAWHCQSVGYYGNMKCQDATFSEDGSLLAVAYEEVITLWNPATNELHRTLHSPRQGELIREMVFGCNESSQYLVVRSSNYLTVWNLLTCSVWWSLEASVSVLLADPSSKHVAAFVRFYNKKTHLYVFDPSSPRPVAVQENVEKTLPVVCAVFVPSESQAPSTNKENPLKSRLYFLNFEQELYTIDSEPETKDVDQPSKELIRDPEKEQTEFSKVFGMSTKTATASTFAERAEKTVRGTPSSAVVREMIATPSHVLPPVRTLCAAFLKSLLISKQRDRDPLEPEDEDDASDKAESEAEDESDMETEESTQTVTTDPCLVTTDQSPVEQSVDYKRQKKTPGDFTFLEDFFS